MTSVVDPSTTPAPFVVEAWGKQLGALNDSVIRCLALLRLMEGASDLPLVRVFACAQREAALGSSPARMLINVFGQLIDEHFLDDDTRGRLCLAAELIEEFAITGMLSSGRPQPIPSPFVPKRIPKGSLAEQGETLGRRKTLARTERGDTLDRLLLDPHPEVIKNALLNPWIKEDQVVRLAARSNIHEAILTVIARSKFSTRAQVRRALVKNPKCPPTVACRFLIGLTRVELLEVAHDSRLVDGVRDTARALIDAKPPRLAVGVDAAVQNNTPNRTPP